MLGIVETASAADIRLMLTGTDGGRLLKVIFSRSVSVACSVHIRFSPKADI
jgi:hypothetical protein